MRNFLKQSIFLIAISFAATSVLSADAIKYDDGGRRDPFVALVDPNGEVSKGFDPKGMNIEGIIFDPQKGSLVLINGDFYKRGDTVQSATLVDIFKDHIIISQNDTQKTLWIRDDNADNIPQNESQKKSTKNDVHK